MSEGPKSTHRFQVSLASVFVFIAAICMGLALVRAGFAEVALGGAFPFAVGVAIGQFRDNMSPLSSPFIAAFVVPLLWGAIVGCVDSRPGSTFLGNTIGALVLVPGVLVFGAVPALAGAILTRRVSRPVSENPISG